MLGLMTPSMQFSAFSNELQKIAARKGLKLIRGLIEKGTPEALEQANRIALSTKKVVKDVSPAKQKARQMHKRLLKTDPAKAARLEKMMLKGPQTQADFLQGNAKSYSAVKKHRRGSQIKHLGSGMEGTSTLTAHPKRGLEVRKLIDPKGIAGEGMVKHREQLGKKLQHSQDVATFRGARTTKGGLREQRFDYVPPAKAKLAPAPKPAPAGEISTAAGHGRALARGTGTADEISTAVGHGGSKAPGLAQGTGSAGDAAQSARQSAQMKRLKLHGEQAGYKVQDLHRDNMFAAAGGGSKAVDFMAVPQKHTKGVPFGNPKALAKFDETHSLAEKGLRSGFQDYVEDPRRAGNIAARAYRGAAPITPGSSTAYRASRGMPSARTPPPTPRQAGAAVKAPAGVPGKAMMPQPVQAKRKAVMKPGMPGMSTRVG